MLKGKNIWVTGASRGIGLGIAEAILKSGGNCILSARPSEAFEMAFANLTAQYGSDRVKNLSFDAADSVAVQAALRKLPTLTKSLSGFVGNAGVMEDSLLGMIPADLLSRQFQVNVTSTILEMQLASRLMAKNNGGSIVLMTSIIGRLGYAGQVAYAASKAALIGAGLSASKELAPKGVRVNMVAPGFIDTDLTANLPEDKRNKTLQNIGMRRAGTIDDVANLVQFLLSDSSLYITGQTIGVDGGMII